MSASQAKRNVNASPATRMTIDRAEQEEVPGSRAVTPDPSLGCRPADQAGGDDARRGPPTRVRNSPASGSSRSVVSPTPRVDPRSTTLAEPSVHAHARRR